MTLPRPSGMKPCPECGSAHTAVLEPDLDNTIPCDPMYNGGRVEFIPTCTVRCGNCDFTLPPSVSPEIAVNWWDSLPRRHFATSAKARGEKP